MVKNFVPASTEDFKIPLISEMENKTFLIVAVRFDTSSKGEYAIVTTLPDGDAEAEPTDYRTSAKALLTQLHSINRGFKEDDEAVRVLLRKVKGKQWNYLTFDAPE